MRNALTERQLGWVRENLVTIGTKHLIHSIPGRI